MTEQTPLISICLPAYNGVKHIATALESVFAQTVQDFELIVIDDYSTDWTWDLLSSFAKNDPRVRVERNDTRLGLFQNYNKCMSLARGEYIKLFAQDDVLLPKTLELMSAKLQTSPETALVTCGKNWIDDEGNVIKSVVQFNSDRQISGHDAILYNMLSLTNWIGEPSTSMFRRTAAKTYDTRFYHYGDLDLWFQLLRTGDLHYIAEVMVSFRRHTASTTNSNLRGLFFVPDLLILGDKYADILSDLGESHEHYGRRVAETVAMEVNHLAQEENLDAQAVKAVRNRMLAEDEPAEYTLLREALFYSSAQLAEVLHDLYIAKETIKYRDKEIAELKGAMEGITSSKLWKMTAPLRSRAK